MRRVGFRKAEQVKFVIDTNILFAASVHRGASKQFVAELLTRDDWRWLVTDGILREYARILEHTRFRTTAGERALLLEQIRARADLIEAPHLYEVPADPSDAKFLNCAAAGGADYLITSDEHLLSAPPPPGVAIVTMSTFNRLRGESADRGEE